jgi:hypothetical protein
MEKINLNLFDNRYYEIKNTKEQFVDIFYFDFICEESILGSIIDPKPFTRRFNLNKHIIEKFDIENIKKEINKDFGLILSKKGEEHRIYLKPNFSEKIDINEKDLIEKYDGDILKIGQSIYSKIKTISSIIAMEGRFGHAHWILSNQKTYDWFVKKLNNLGTIDNDILFLENIAVDINEAIEDDVLLIGRKNKIDQSGLACAILVDDDNNIIFEEDKITKEISIFFNIIDIGYFSHKQYIKINIIHD